METVNISNLDSDEGFAAGKSIGDKYIIDEPLAKGGMGLTYLAHDIENIKRKAVIKTILKKLSTPEGKAAFLKEGEALGRINHDGVVKLFDKGEDTQTGLPFLVMEYVEGDPLTRIIKRGRMDVRKAVEIAKKIAFALTAAHKEDIIHRDLKPDNIIIVEDDIEGEKVKLIDFGVAKVADSVVGGSTVQGVFKGTLQYASPEQLIGFPSIPGETFTLAAITYEMIAGVHPFQLTVGRRNDESDTSFSGRCYEQIKALQAENVKNPKEYNPALPEATALVILKGLALDVNNRYKTPLEFARELTKSLTNVPSTLPTIVDVPVPPQKNWKRITMAAFGILLLTAATILGLLYFNSVNKTVASNLNGSASPSNTEQVPQLLFSYSLEVQKMKNGIIDGKPFSTVNVKYRISTGDKFNLKIERQKSGRFYIIEQQVSQWPEASDSSGAYMPHGYFNILFPNSGEDAKNISTWQVAKKDHVFWLVWSKNSVEVLENPFDQLAIETFLRENQNHAQYDGNNETTEIRSSYDTVVLSLAL